MKSNILIIDDEQLIRKEALDVLTLEGFSIAEAKNGREGIQMAQKQLPDLIICNMMMPEKDGYSTVETLRTSPETAIIPFIFLAAKSQQNHNWQGEKWGYNDYLTKPFTNAELLDAVRTRLAERAVITQYFEQKLDTLRSSIIQALPQDFRTPLINILRFAEILSWDTDQLTTNQIQQMAESIQQSGKRLYRLVENYLLYTQIEIIMQDSKRLVTIRASRTANPHKIVSEIAIAQARLVGREADIHLQIDNMDTPMRASQDDLEKIVEELINNAFKFSDKGTPVRVTSTSNGGWYELSIEDKGRGMSPEQIRASHAIQFNRTPFEQPDADSGIALVIIRRLVEMYAGSIMIESTLNQGTHMVIRLPLVN